MRYVLTHRHAPAQCGVAYAAWRGFESPLRHGSALGTCASEPSRAGADHLLVWTIDAATPGDALSLLPQWLAERTEVRPIAEVQIP